MPDIMPDRMSDTMPERMPDIMPDRMSDRMPDRMAEYMSEYMSGRMPDRMPEYMSDRMSEYIKRPDMSWWGSHEVKYFFSVFMFVGL